MERQASDRKGGLCAAILFAASLFALSAGPATARPGPALDVPQGPPSWTPAADARTKTTPTPREERATQPTPETDEIPPRGLTGNFTLVSHLPLLDNHQYVGEPLGIPRGSNGDITASGDCVYVGSFIGYQPALIVDVSNPRRPTVVGPVPDLVPGVGNGIEGIEASGDLLVIDQRRALGGLGFEVPAGLPSRGLAIYDISDCRNPVLVARYDFGDKHTHTVSLWRDPQSPDRVLGIQSFSDNPDVQVIDLTGCPDVCTPTNIANWDAEEQFGGERASTHEAILSTDGKRIYMSQYRDGVFLLDSSRLIETLRGNTTCNPAAPTSPTATGHCVTALNPDYEARWDSAPPLGAGWHHTPIKVPDRPYLFEVEESSGPQFVPELGRITSDCPGSFLWMIYIGEDEFAFGDGEPMRGDLNPQAVGVYGTDEQALENCGPDGFKPGTAPLESSWFSPHDGLMFPNLAIYTYYGAGLRAIDISNPFILREVGYFINNPVDEVRWASYGPVGEVVLRDDGLAHRRPAAGDPMVFAFSYVLSHNGYIIYSDVHSGLYILKYRGPHRDSIPQRGNCIAGNPGAIEAGFEPCPPYGQTNWGTPGVE